MEIETKASFPLISNQKGVPSRTEDQGRFLLVSARELRDSRRPTTAARANRRTGVEDDRRPGGGPASERLAALPATGRSVARLSSVTGCQLCGRSFRWARLALLANGRILDVTCGMTGSEPQVAIAAPKRLFGTEADGQTFQRHAEGQNDAYAGCQDRRCRSVSAP